MKVFVTGAGGFVGKAVVAAAVASGHSVMAMCRPISRNPTPDFPDGVQTVIGDLCQTGEWQEALQEADAIIHCAVRFNSLADSVLATENLLAAAPAGLTRFVHVSSFAVYDYTAPRWLATMDEHSPVEREPERRDVYTQLKLRQEQLIGDHCREHAIPLVMTRPVAIYGTSRNWLFGCARKLGPLDLIFGPLSKLRLIHVEDCASALVAALTARLDGRDAVVINLIATELCGHWSFHRQARKFGAKTGFGIPVPYVLLRTLGWTAVAINKLFFSGRKTLPKTLEPVLQEVSWRPFRYSNKAARTLLNWEPRVSLRSGIREIVEFKNFKKTSG
ncbi:hypothetical protein NSE01_12450 [Novosphingobium sediminis]|uniref:NAD-dependent epimerase/dehydratase domain-containing protein n=1 Tax=Novosphingobium sediminis TaxID=707214 RepID=A0A512AIG8_9SPHN|nr:NAD(P)-dependent oxidoreductase [Novosphingobium sediminis]GEN99412.1 hypothetical protein NSE01_12450 [Novosphingobium sediminis]